MDLAPRFIEGYPCWRCQPECRANISDENETVLKKALSLAPGREELRMLLAQTYLKAERNADARAILAEIEHITSDPEMRRRASALPKDRAIVFICRDHACN